MGRILKGIGIVVMITGIVVMAGWYLDIEVLKSIVPGFVTMKFATALSFLLSGLILFFVVSKETQRQESLSSIVLSIAPLVLLLLMGTSLFSNLFGFHSGIEYFFVMEEPGAVLTVTPGRPSVGTMSAFVLIAAIGLIAMSRWERRRIAYMVLGGLVVLLGSIALLGYMLDIPLLYYTIEDKSSAMALHTATLFVLIGGASYTLAQWMKRSRAVQ